MTDSSIPSSHQWLVRDAGSHYTLVYPLPVARDLTANAIGAALAYTASEDTA
jgi:hypothetical protein